MFMSQAQEIQMDKQWAAHQFSADYGAVQDRELNAYVSDLGMAMGQLTHRPHMPYNFRVVNATNVNGYTFPGGSVAVTRGLMLSCRDEAELAAVLGHELGHVNARHVAQQMTKQTLVSAVVMGAVAYVQKEEEKYAGLAAGLGGIGASLLLARYSRNDEREADDVGMGYAVKAGHNPQGMAGVMATFMSLRKNKPSVVELLFSTHPLSDERYKTAVHRAHSQYEEESRRPYRRERYMDRTARLRTLRGAIEEMQKAEMALALRKNGEAEERLRSALRKAPDDYAALLMMSKCSLAQKKSREAERLAAAARAAYPAEPQAYHVGAMAKIKGRKYESAIADLKTYESRLPGNPNTIFFEGYCLEKMGRRAPAAEQYARYLQASPQGEFSEYTRSRLAEWGYARPSAN
jgi:predicted Zn-dependent protease